MKSRGRAVRQIALGVTGGLMLALFGVVLTFLPAHFGRTYAAYGGVFVVLSVLWGWQVDGRTPDLPDGIGAAIVMAGVGVMMLWPRA